MTRYSSDTKQRRSKRYIELHRQLKAECTPQPIPDSDKLTRKRQASAQFRATGA